MRIKHPFLLIVVGLILSVNTIYSQCDASDPGFVSIDFETDAFGNQLQAGQVITNQYASYGITILGSSGDSIVIFDSANPSGGDCDLGTPSFHCSSNLNDLTNDCAGIYPGQSNEAGSGGGQNNCSSLNNIIIVEETFTDINGDGLDDDPDDKGAGGSISFIFDNPYNFQRIGIVDDASGSFVATLSGGSTETINFDVGLDNDTLILNPNLINVTRVDVNFNSSGAISFIEFCDLVTGKIGDQLFIDINGNGTYDVGIDDPIENVDVTLTFPDNSSITTATDQNGQYNFENLSDGNYTVSVNINDPDFPNNIFNTVDYDNGNDNTASVQIFNGNEMLAVDFGYEYKGKIGDQLYEDVNGNGLFDETIDNVLVGVEVIITYPDNSTKTLITNSEGKYLFENLPAGSYEISINESSLPVGIINSVDPDNTADNKYTHVLSATEEYLESDFGYYFPASLGDYVWLDVNANGIQDITEDGLNGITVNLYNSTGTLLKQTTTILNPDTGNDGHYIFENLQPGDYYVKFETGSYTISPADQGSNDLSDSDIDNSFGQGTTDLINIVSGESDNTVDAGIYLPKSLGNYVWHDENGNGIQDLNEDGVSNVEIILLNDSGDIIQTKITDETGYYQFDNLPSGSYEIRFSAPENYEFTLKDIGDNREDSDVNISGSTGLFDFNIENGNDLNWDAGIYIPAQIGNYVWNDLDGNGIQDGIESGLSNVTVTLKNSSGITIDSKVTDNEGQYLFSVTPDTYYLEFMYPDGAIKTSGDQGGDDSIDSDISDANGPNTTNLINVNSGDNLDHIDGGAYYPGSVGDYVWFDENNDGIYNGSDSGISDVKVHLKNSNGETIATVTSDKNGYYSFENLPMGTFYIFVDAPSGMVSTIPNNGDDTKDSDLSGAKGMNTTDEFLLGANEDNMHFDLGFSFSIVPVKYTAFEVTQLPNIHYIEWTCSIEIDNDYFEIQRKLDNGEFETIGTINSYGDTNTEVDYQFPDRDTDHTGKYYYRLKQVDLDGTIEYSNIIYVQKTSDRVNVNIFPNPTQDFLTIDFNFITNTQSSINIYSAQGRLVEKVNVDAGVNFKQLNLQDLDSGNYFIKISNDKIQLQKTFIKVN